MVVKEKKVNKAVVNLMVTGGPDLAGGDLEYVRKLGKIEWTQVDARLVDGGAADSQCCAKSKHLSAQSVAGADCPDNSAHRKIVPQHPTTKFSYKSPIGSHQFSIFWAF